VDIKIEETHIHHKDHVTREESRIHKYGKAVATFLSKHYRNMSATHMQVQEAEDLEDAPGSLSEIELGIHRDHYNIVRSLLLRYGKERLSDTACKGTSCVREDKQILEILLQILLILITQGNSLQ
jgi:hypothetical protein